MKIAMFGTGIVGQTLAIKLFESKNEIMFGTRDVAKTLAKTEKDGYGNPPFSLWLQRNPSVKVGTFSDAAEFGELIINATSGSGSLPAFQSVGAEKLRDKIMIDIANPLDFSKGFPPSLTVCNADSLAEQLQRAFPDMKIVKALNTMNCMVMVNPGLVPGDHNVFLSGNDAEARKKVSVLLNNWFGWPSKNIIDLGDITTARGTEMLLPIWVRLLSALKNPVFNFHVAIGSMPVK